MNLRFLRPWVFGLVGSIIVLLSTVISQSMVVQNQQHLEDKRGLLAGIERNRLFGQVTTNHAEMTASMAMLKYMTYEERANERLNPKDAKSTVDAFRSIRQSLADCGRTDRSVHTRQRAVAEIRRIPADLIEAIFRSNAKEKYPRAGEPIEKLAGWPMEEKAVISEAELEKLHRLCSYFEERKVRASERLAASIEPQWNFALVGFKSNVERFVIPGLAEIRRVAEPPGEVELAAAVNDQTLFGAIGRYSRAITHELAINRSSWADQSGFNLAWWIVSAIRVKTLAEILVPAVSDHSWSTIPAITNRTCHVQLLEDVPQARRLEDPTIVQETDFAWVRDRILVFADMLEVPKFRLAVMALTTHQHLLSLRMMVASLWAGIEALVGIQAELRYRLALSVACLIEPRGPERVARYVKVKKLYDVRSKAVHGAALTDADLVEHVSEARKLLSSMICTMVDEGKVMSEADFDRKLLVE